MQDEFEPLDTSLSEETVPLDAADDEPAEFEIITCPQCAHPNLEFRGHCRQCGGKLQGSVNLIIGAEFVEWTATDGPGRHAKALGVRTLIAFLGVIVLLLILPLLFSAGLPLPAIAIVGVVAASGLVYALWANTTHEMAASSDEEAPICPFCAEPVGKADDVCASCGRIIAPEVLSNS